MYMYDIDLSVEKSKQLNGDYSKQTQPYIVQNQVLNRDPHSGQQISTNSDHHIFNFNYMFITLYCINFQ